MQQLFFSELLVQACDPAGGGVGRKSPGKGVQGNDAAVYHLFSMTAPGFQSNRNHCRWSLQLHTAWIKQKQSGEARTKPSGVFMAVCSFLHVSLIGLSGLPHLWG